MASRMGSTSRQAATPRQATARKGRAADTRAALLQAAARLFAAQGIEGPSLREINLAAGQRNNSALHYHFTDREGLLRAILASHGERLRQRRAALFEQAVVDGALGDIARVAEMMVRPLADELERGEDALDFIIIVTEVVRDPTRDYAALEGLYQDPLVPEVSRMLASLTGLPPALIPERVVTAVFQSMDAVAARARRMRVQSPRPMVPTEVFTANLVDMLVGAVTVAPSARTLAALEEAGD